MGDAKRRGSFEQRRKEAIDRNAKEAAELAAIQAARPRPRTSNAMLALQAALAISAVTMSQKGGA